jgi:ABC-type phosphate transport system ATPase subunit
MDEITRIPVAGIMDEVKDKRMSGLSSRRQQQTCASHGRLPSSRTSSVRMMFGIRSIATLKIEDLMRTLEDYTIIIVT